MSSLLTCCPLPEKVSSPRNTHCQVLLLLGKIAQISLLVVDMVLDRDFGRTCKVQKAHLSCRVLINLPHYQLQYLFYLVPHQQTLFLPFAFSTGAVHRSETHSFGVEMCNRAVCQTPPYKEAHCVRTRHVNTQISGICPCQW